MRVFRRFSIKEGQSHTTPDGIQVNLLNKHTAQVVWTCSGCLLPSTGKCFAHYKRRTHWFEIEEEVGARRCSYCRDIEEQLDILQRTKDKLEELKARHATMLEQLTALLDLHTPPKSLSVSDLQVANLVVIRGVGASWIVMIEHDVLVASQLADAFGTTVDTAKVMIENQYLLSQRPKVMLPQVAGRPLPDAITRLSSMVDIFERVVDARERIAGHTL